MMMAVSGSHQCYVVAYTSGVVVVCIFYTNTVPPGINSSSTPRVGLLRPRGRPKYVRTTLERCSYEAQRRLSRTLHGSYVNYWLHGLVAVRFFFQSRCQLVRSKRRGGASSQRKSQWLQLGERIDWAYHGQVMTPTTRTRASGSAGRAWPIQPEPRRAHC